MDCNHEGKYEYRGIWHCPHCGKDYDEILLEWIDIDSKPEEKDNEY